MNDDTWYEWSVYSEFLAMFSARLSPAALTSVGFGAIKGLRARFVGAGLDTADKLLADMDAVVTLVSKDLPEPGRIRTVEFWPGHAVIETGALRPPEIVEGYLRGIVILFGQVPGDMKRTTFDRDGDVMYRIELSWT